MMTGSNFAYHLTEQNIFNDDRVPDRAKKYKNNNSDIGDQDPSFSARAEKLHEQACQSNKQKN